MPQLTLLRLVSSAGDTLLALACSLGRPAKISAYLYSLSPKHGERDSARLLRLPVRRRCNVLVRGTIRDAFQRIRNARHLIHDLVADRRPLHDHGAPPAELLHRPGGRSDDEDYDREKLFITCDSYRPAKKVKNMIREQVFLPAGAESNNYLIGCHFGADCQPHSQSHRRSRKAVAGPS